MRTAKKKTTKKQAKTQAKLPPVEAPLEFKRGAYTHTLMSQTGKVCLYRQSSHAFKSPDHYEVVIMQFQQEREMPDGRKFEAKWVIPTSSTWGVYGHTLMSLEKAEAKFEEIVERELAKQKASK